MQTLKRFFIVFGCLTAVVLFFNANARGVETVAQASAAPTPGFIPWYPPSPVPWPSPLSNADAAIAGAFGAAHFYNAVAASPDVAGVPMLALSACQFVCFGAPGHPSHHIVAYGNAVDPTAFTTQGAPADCMPVGLVTIGCPGGVMNSVFSVTFHGIQPPNGGYFVSVDGKANLGAFGKIVAGSSVIAGAGAGTPEPSPTPGSLVTHTGNGQGELLMGSSADFITCDYGVTAASTLTCNKPIVAGGLTSTGGMRPNGSSGGYAPDAFPDGADTSHPRMVSGNCDSPAGSVVCTFGNGRTFTDTAFSCTVTAFGQAPRALSYEIANPRAIVVHSSAPGRFSYMCLGS